MEIYKKLYEAINTGILKALVLDDEDDVSIIYLHKKICNTIDFMEQYVNELLKGFDIRNAYIKIYDLYKKTGCMYHVKNYNELKIIIIISANIFYGLDLNWLDVSDITDMHGLFSPYYDCNGEKCNYLVSEPLKKANLNISDWDLSHVTNMDDIDYGCDNFKI